VRQPSISQFLAERTPMIDDMVDRLLSCMGFRLEIHWRPVRQELGRSPQRSRRLHRQLATHPTPKTLHQWRPTMQGNLDRLRASVQGQPTYATSTAGSSSSTTPMSRAYAAS
jgi:hypothetical protein